MQKTTPQNSITKFRDDVEHHREKIMGQKALKKSHERTLSKLLSSPFCDGQLARIGAQERFVEACTRSIRFHQNAIAKALKQKTAK